jgi:ABC-type multidrug transport system ATPase subunit
MSMVFQFPSSTELQHLRQHGHSPAQCRHGRRRYGRSPGDSPEFGIDEGSWNEKASNLSISERQRLSLAHAFAVERNVYILDEPFSMSTPRRG